MDELAKLVDAIRSLALRVKNLETQSHGGGSGASAFTDLTDVPAAYTGAANKFVKVNAGANALEFVAGSGTVTEGPGIDVVGDQVGIGLDSILVAFTDGSPAAEYAFTDAGLTAALANANTLIFLPAGTLTGGPWAMSAGITLVGQGTTLVGTLLGPTSGSVRIHDLIVPVDLVSGDAYAIQLQGGDIELINCEVSGFTDSGDGYGIYGYDEGLGTVTVRDGKVSGSTAPAKLLQYTSGEIYLDNINVIHSVLHVADLSLNPGHGDVTVWTADACSSNGAGDGGDLWFDFGVAQPIGATLSFHMASYTSKYVFLYYSTNGVDWTGISGGELGGNKWRADGDRTYPVEGYRYYRICIWSDSYTGAHTEWYWFRLNTGLAEEDLTDTNLLTSGGVEMEALGIPLLGERSAFDADGYPSRHANDIDTTTGIHHTLDYLNSHLSILGIMPYTLIEDQKSAGTAGGSFSSGAWRTRTLNTSVVDNIGITLASNQFTLPAGTYRFNIQVPGYHVDFHKARLYNITAGATSLVGSTAIAGSTSYNLTFSTIHGEVTIVGDTVFEVQHRCSTTQADGFGNATNLGEIEIFTVVEILKVG